MLCCLVFLLFSASFCSQCLLSVLCCLVHLVCSKCVVLSSVGSVLSFLVMLVFGHVLSSKYVALSCGVCSLCSERVVSVRCCLL